MPDITPVWLKQDVPDLDNTLNLLSTLSMDNVNRATQKTWGDAGVLSTFLGPLVMITQLFLLILLLLIMITQLMMITLLLLLMLTAQPPAE